MERHFRYFFTIDKANSLHQGHVTSLPSPDFSIIGENLDHSNDARYFTSFHFNKTDDTNAVWAKGKYLLLLYNGACRIFLYNPMPDPDFISLFSDLELRELYLVDPKLADFDDSTHKLLKVQNHWDILPLYPFDDSINFLGKDRINPLITDITKSIFIAKDAPDVCALLLLAGKSLDWISLYSMLDTIQNFHPDFKKLIVSNGITEKDINAFTGTANSFGLLGANARHGIKNWQIPKKTIGLKEAQQLIFSLSKAYLKDQHSI